jgi:hypothetical protein
MMDVPSDTSRGDALRRESQAEVTEEHAGRRR